jgi:hypothetical protein
MRIVLCGTFACIVTVLASLGAAFGQDSSFATGPQYLMNHGSQLFARPISTPSMSLSGPPLEVGADNATGVLIAGAENQTVVPPSAVALPHVDFFSAYYGVTPANVIEIRFSEARGEQSTRGELPASILDNTGVWQLTTAQALRERGYGVTLVEAGAYSKSLARHASHIYTNADIERLHRGS